MKTKQFKMNRFMILILLLAVIACSKDDNGGSNVDPQARENFEQNYYNVIDGEFSNKPLPESNSQTLEIVSLTGNSTVLPGGSNPISISANGNPTQVILGVQGQPGYYIVPMTAERGAEGRGTSISSIESSLLLLVGQEASGNFTIAFTVSDGQGNFSAYEYLDVTYMEAGTGLLQVNLSWDQLNDVDLHVIEPDGEEIYYGDSSSSNGGQLDVDSNAACSIDGINNENIYYEDDPSVTIENGEYEVLVDLWSNCDIPDNTIYNVRVIYDGVTIATTQGSNPYSGSFVPSDESMNSSPTSVLKFNIDGSATRGTAEQSGNNSLKVYKFDFKNDTERPKILSPEKM